MKLWICISTPDHNDHEYAVIRAESKEEAIRLLKEKFMYFGEDDIQELMERGPAEVIWKHTETYDEPYDD